MKIDDAKKLHQKKYRQEFGHYLVEGEHLILELQKAALTNLSLQKSRLFVTERHADWQSPFHITVIGDKQMAQLSDTKTPQGIVAVVPLPEPALPQVNERAVYLYEIQDPGNLGTILRTLGWFGGFRCLLSPNATDAWSPKAVRSSMGAIFHVPIEVDVPLHSLTARYKHIASLDMHGEPVYSSAFKQSDCLIFGNEARGIPADLQSHLTIKPFNIHGSPVIESLNLASAVNIGIYELTRPISA
jgi:TrmH family RNA methyltransferase